MNEAAQPQELLERVRDGLSHLDRAAKELDSLATDDDASDVDELKQCIDVLRAFGDVFAAFAEGAASPDTKRRLIDAGSGLALYFDDSEKAIAESAKFWQGAAYRRAGKPDRALQVLRPAITTPVTPRIGLWARLERCRALADRDEYVAAIALSLRASARVESWFDGEDEDTRGRAADSLKRVRAELYQGWANRLRAQGQNDQAKVAASEAKKLLGRDADALPADHWLTLTESIAGVPEIKFKTDELDEKSEDQEP